MTRMITYDFWVILSGRGSVRISRRVPSLDSNERAMKLKMEIPASVFTVPMLTAKITVDDERAFQHTIDVNAVSEALQGVIGANVTVTLDNPEIEPVSVPDDLIRRLVNE